MTARRREESLLDVPIAVTAYSGAALEQSGASDITAISDTTPNVTLENSRATNSTLTAFIRGVGQQDPVGGFEAGVGERHHKGVEDVGDAAGHDIALGERPRVGFVGEGAIAVEGDFIEEMGGGRGFVFGF